MFTQSGHIKTISRIKVDVGHPCKYMHKDALSASIQYCKTSAYIVGSKISLHINVLYQFGLTVTHFRTVKFYLSNHYIQKYTYMYTVRARGLITN